MRKGKGGKGRGKGQKKETDEPKKPEYFDLNPFLKTFKQFVDCNAEVRSSLRVEMSQYSDTISKIFVDKYNEPSFKKCIDIMTIE